MYGAKCQMNCRLNCRVLSWLLGWATSRGACKLASAGLIPVGSAVFCRASSLVAIGGKPQSVKQVQTRCPWAEERATVREQVCLLKGPGQVSARPEGLSPVVRAVVRSPVVAFGLRERSSRFPLSCGRKGGSFATAVQSRKSSQPLSGLGVWGLVSGVSAPSRRYRCTMTLVTLDARRSTPDA